VGKSDLSTLFSDFNPYIYKEATGCGVSILTNVEDFDHNGPSNRFESTTCGNEGPGSFAPFEGVTSLRSVSQSVASEIDRGSQAGLPTPNGRWLIIRCDQGVPAYVIQVPGCLEIVGSPLVLGSIGHISIQCGGFWMGVTDVAEGSEAL
jgi:hypothetical protein